MRIQRRRLARAFQAALLAVGSPAIVIACSSSDPSAASDGGGSPDATAADATLDSFTPQSEDATVRDVASPPALDGAADDGNPTPVMEAAADTGGCFAGSYELDSGPDADAAMDMCVYVYACGLGGTGLGLSGCQVLQVIIDGGLAPFPQMTCWLAEDAGCLDDALAPGDEAGGVSVLCSPCTGGGRRPAGLCAPRKACADTGLGGYLARMAFEEEASIVAFERMGAELGSLGAPAKLATAAARAARDETRHAKTMSKLAVARGAKVAKARVRRIHTRSAAAVAAENAAEGCVRETYGALVALWQSHHAEDVEVRRAFKKIAPPKRPSGARDS